MSSFIKIEFDFCFRGMLLLQKDDPIITECNFISNNISQGENVIEYIASISTQIVNAGNEIF